MELLGGGDCHAAETLHVALAPAVLVAVPVPAAVQVCVAAAGWRCSAKTQKATAARGLSSMLHKWLARRYGFPPFAPGAWHPPEVLRGCTCGGTSTNRGGPRSGGPFRLPSATAACLGDAILEQVDQPATVRVRSGWPGALRRRTARRPRQAQEPEVGGNRGRGRSAIQPAACRQAAFSPEWRWIRLARQPLSQGRRQVAKPPAAAARSAADSTRRPVCPPKKTAARRTNPAGESNIPSPQPKQDYPTLRVQWEAFGATQTPGGPWECPSAEKAFRPAVAVAPRGNVATRASQIAHLPYHPRLVHLSGGVCDRLENVRSSFLACSTRSVKMADL